MDYQASQSLANDLLAGSTNLGLHDLRLDLNSGDDDESRNRLQQPGLWSDSESDHSSSGEGDDVSRANQLKEDVRAAARFRRKAPGKNKRTKDRTAQETLPTFEVQGMLGSANQKFVERDLDGAQKILEEIIRIDYNVFNAWQLLGELHKERGSVDKCMTAWMTAAHLRPKDGDIWALVSTLSVQSGLVDQADYCYNKLCQARPRDVDIVWDRAMLNKDNGRTKKAIDCFRQILKLIPYEMTTVRELARMYLQQDRVEEALALYTETSNHYMSTQASDVFDWSELNIMAEIYVTAAESGNRLELWRVVIARIKTVARWLCGRPFETWWNERSDDAEWDHDSSRRKHEPRFISSTHENAYSLPLELRVKLGKARLMLHDKAEAMRHFDFLDGQEAEEVSDLFLEAADALLMAESWEEALELYSKLTEVEEANGSDVWRSMGKAFLATEDFEQAEECLDAVLANDPDDTNALVMQAELYERTDRRPEALEAINRVIELRRPPAEGDTGTTADDFFTVVDEGEVADAAFFEIEERPAERSATRRRKPRRGTTRRQRTTADLEAYEERKARETSTKFKAIDLAREAMLINDMDATRQWMSCASDLVDDFKNIKHFFPNERKYAAGGIRQPPRNLDGNDLSLSAKLQGMADRLQESIIASQAVSKTAFQQPEFRGFLFSTWLEVFFQYALLLTLTGDEKEGYGTLEMAASSAVFSHDEKLLMQIHTTRACLSILARDTRAGAEHARRVMLNYLFRDDGVRLYCTALSSGILGHTLYTDSSNQKFLLRLIKTMDSLHTGRTMTGTVKLRQADLDNESLRPRSVHPILLLVYGHISACGRGYTAAIHYYARAYAYAPGDPQLLFSIGLAYLHRSMQRQSDNRHLQIMQAFSFLLQYYDLRIEGGDPDYVQEAEYNVGRALHQLGLVHLALKYYERAIHVVGVSPKYDLTQNVIYNMSLIYVLAGNSAKARALSVAYLTL